ncbi:OmpR/PhoB-type domain-containing protein [Pseudomonas sp. IT-347P]|uniref:ATP-binding protein n=1 Tax=Pseudomonas sp. IT-347P TaxID=3026458 RepID=UPI0039E1F416
MEPFADNLPGSLTTQFVFGPFCVVPAKRQLEKNGRPVEIGGRALDLLIALLEQPGRVIAKNELIKQVWPDSIVEEGSLRFHMTGLRRILGDGDEHARYIATQVGVGYAFVAALEKKQVRFQSASVAMAPADSRADEPRCSLPARAKLIGRESDLQLVVEHMLQPKLFTLVGPGGVGKTSLAIEVAHRTAAQGYQTVRFVDLAQVEDPALVLSALARSLEIPVQAEDSLFVLLAHLRTQRLLLVIDNCEHVIDAVSAMVEEISEAAPNVGVLATSREPLRARGEYVHWLNPLAFPREPQRLQIAELLEFAAIRLFIERASSGNAAWLPDAADAQLIADMCLRLEGMALPIELAAMRVASHGLKSTHALLGERFSLGWSGRRTALPRHQTLRAMLDWSYELLSPLERLALERFSVFVGPFSQEAVSQVIADEQIDAAVAAAMLDELVCKGLVAIDHSDSTWTYRLLEMTRAYTREKLMVRGDAECNALAFRHAAFYMDLLGHLGTSPNEIFLRSARLASQLGNVRSALEWSFGPEGDPGLALPLAAASAALFLHFSLLVECRTWCSRAAELLELGYFGTSTEMELQAALGLVLMFTRGNSASAEKALLRALDIATAAGDYWSQLRLLGRLQIFYERIGDFASSLMWAERAGEVGVVLNRPEASAIASSLLGISHHLLGNQPLARQQLERSLRDSLPSKRSGTIYYGFDHRNRTGLALARTLWLQGFADQARDWAQQIEREALALQHSVTYCIAMVWILCIYIWTGDLHKALASLEQFSVTAESNALAPYIAAAHGFRAMIAIRAEQPGNAVAVLEESLTRLHGMRYELLTTSFEIALAEGLMLNGQHIKAMEVVNGTIRHCRASGDAFALPELLRIRAGTLKASDEKDIRAATVSLEESLALSRAQGAWAWEVRTSMDLARLSLEHGDRERAITLLGNCREGLSEGFDTLDVRRLQALWHSVQESS